MIKLCQMNSLRALKQLAPALSVERLNDAEAVGAGRIETTENPAEQSAVVRNRFLPICKPTTFAHLQPYLIGSVYKAVLQKSIPAQIRQLFLYDY